MATQNASSHVSFFAGALSLASFTIARRARRLSKLQSSACAKRGAHSKIKLIRHAGSFTDAKYDGDLRSPDFSVLQYNILAGNLGTAGHFPYVKKESLAWETRKKLIVENVVEKGASIVCMEELNDYEEYFKPTMSKFGYDSVYAKRPSLHTSSWSGVTKYDGCGIFFQESLFDYVDSDTLVFNDTHDRIALFVLLRMKNGGKNIIFASTHLYWNIKKIDVQLAELRELGNKLKQLKDKWFGIDSSPHVNVAGDFNNTPGSHVYQYMENDLAFKSAYRDYKSAKANIKFPGVNEPPHTTVNYKRCQTIDYIWHSPNLEPTALLEIPSEEELRSECGPPGWEDAVNKEKGKYILKTSSNNNGIPNSRYGSDHVPIMARFVLLPSSL